MRVNQHFYLTALLLIILLTILALRLPDKPADEPIFEPPDKVTRNQIEPSRGGRILHMEATAYCLEDGSGTGLTATGTIPQEGRTVAVDPNVIPYGTELSINGKSGYIAEDTGGAIKSHRIDVFMTNRKDASRFGRQTVRVQIVGGDTND